MAYQEKKEREGICVSMRNWHSTFLILFPFIECQFSLLTHDRTNMGQFLILFLYLLLFMAHGLCGRASALFWPFYPHPNNKYKNKMRIGPENCQSRKRPTKNYYWPFTVDWQARSAQRYSVNASNIQATICISISFYLFLLDCGLMF